MRSQVHILSEKKKKDLTDFKQNILFSRYGNNTYSFIAHLKLDEVERLTNALIFTFSKKFVLDNTLVFLQIIYVFCLLLKKSVEKNSYEEFF